MHPERRRETACPAGKVAQTNELQPGRRVHRLALRWSEHVRALDLTPSAEEGRYAAEQISRSLGQERNARDTRPVSSGRQGWSFLRRRSHVWMAPGLQAKS